MDRLKRWWALLVQAVNVWTVGVAVVSIVASLGPAGLMARFSSLEGAPAKAVAREEARIQEYLSQVQAEAERHRAEAAAPTASELTQRIAASFDDRIHRARSSRASHVIPHGRR